MCCLWVCRKCRRLLRKDTCRSRDRYPHGPRPDETVLPPFASLSAAFADEAEMAGDSETANSSATGSTREQSRESSKQPGHSPTTQDSPPSSADSPGPPLLQAAEQRRQAALQKHGGAVPGQGCVHLIDEHIRVFHASKFVDDSTARPLKGQNPPPTDAKWDPAIMRQNAPNGGLPTHPWARAIHPVAEVHCRIQVCVQAFCIPPNAPAYKFLFDRRRPYVVWFRRCCDRIYRSREGEELDEATVRGWVSAGQACLAS